MKNKITPVFYFGLLSLIFLTACPKKPVVVPAPPAPPAPPVVEEEKEEELEIIGKEFTEIPQLKTVYFEFDKYDILPEAEKILTENVKYLKANPELEILIEGHCCECGTHDYNMGLGTKRAKAVRDFYKALGIDVKRMATISYGEEMPVARNACLHGHTEAGTVNMRSVTKVRKP